MKLLAYKGRSLISKAIQWQTRSPYSHIGIQLFSGRVVEAWHVGGVQCNPSMGTVHSRGTKIDVFRVEHNYDPEEVKLFLMQQIGKRYDFAAVARFLSRRNAQANDKWFCSELALAAFPFLLSRVKPSHVSPGMLVMSPHLVWEREATV